MARSFRYTVLYWKMTQNSSFPCLPSADDAFGPWAGRRRRGFDFTLLFEESILALPVSCLLILSIPVRMLQLASEKRKVIYSPLQFQKLVRSSNLDQQRLQLMNPERCCHFRSFQYCTPCAVGHPALFCHSSYADFYIHRSNFLPGRIWFRSAFVLLSFYEHTRSVRPSSLLSTYLLLSTLMDTARARTLWTIHTKPVVPSILTCSLLIRCILLLLESTE